MHRNEQGIQARLLILAALFLGIYSLALTLAPAVRARSWTAVYNWRHWIGTLVWLVGYGLAHHQSQRYLPHRDPKLLPVIALISGWGLLTIWRLTPTFGLRQTLWLAISLSVFILGLRLPSALGFLRRYKYLWLTSGLVLTALTLIFGTNPLGYGPRLWLGCCGLYLQPSEPLKLLLVVYLSAYFADWSGILTSKGSDLPTVARAARFKPQIQILIPTLVMTGLALLLLLVQRDLGTASIFILIYSTMVFLATGWRWVPLASTGVLAGAGLLGYLIFDVIRLRIDAWINPWLDPAGRSYQIVQSILAIANGGMWGRGPGLGSPTLVPVAHSDFIFTAIAEEGGLVGTIGFLILLGLLAQSGLRIALQAPDSFRRYLAAGLTTFLIAQSVLIMGGNLRLLPLTGVTLPFVSYGGSSLLVSIVIALLLLHTSATQANQRPPHSSNIQVSVIQVATALFVFLAAAALVAGWWAYVRGPDLLTRTDNARRAIADRSVPRGSLLDRHMLPLAETSGQTGEMKRRVLYPELGPIIGYSHPTYGQSGLEASLDPILRGVEGNEPFTTWWNHILYGQPPPGLDIRLTLDLDLQRRADELLGGHTGSLVLINAENGEILVMVSHPTFDPNQLDEQWDNLVQDPQAPLLNRATQGVYPTGDLVNLPFIQATANPEVGPLVLRLPLANANYPLESTPIEIALAAAVMSSGGTRPALIIAQLRANPKGGWLRLPNLNEPMAVLDPQDAESDAHNLAVSGTPFWEIMLTPAGEDLTWFVGGTTPDWDGLSLAVVLVLEEANLPLVEEIGQTMLSEALGTK